MASANIKIEQDGTTSAPGLSRDDIVIGPEVRLRNGNDANVTGWRWSLSAPAGSTASLSNIVGAAPTFTPDVAGTYIAELKVNSGFAPGEISKVAIAVRNAPVTVGGQTFQTRYLGIKEEFEANWDSIYTPGETNMTGWWEDLNLWLQLIQTVGVSGGGGGGSQTLAQVLALGNKTGGVQIAGDDTAIGDGGKVILVGGNSLGGNGAGGEGILGAGSPDPSGGAGGNIRVAATDAIIQGPGGSVLATAGNGEGTGNGGDFVIRPGVANGTGDDGKVQLDADVVAEYNAQVKFDLVTGGNIASTGAMLLRSQPSNPVAPTGQDGTLWVDNIGDLYYSTVGNDLNLSAGISPPTPAPWSTTLDPVATGAASASYTGPFSPIISAGQVLGAETDLAITVGRGPAGGTPQDADLLLVDSTPAGAFALTPRGGVYSLGYGALLGAFTGLQPGEDGGDVANFAGDQSLPSAGGSNADPGNVIELPGSGRPILSSVVGSKTGAVWIGQPPASGSPLPLRTAGVFGEDWAYSGSLIGQPASVTPSGALTGGDWEVKGGDVTQSDTTSQTYTSVKGGNMGAQGGDATIYDWPLGINPPMTDQTAGNGYVRGGLLDVPDVSDITGTVPRNVRCGNGVVYGGGYTQNGGLAPLVNGGNAILWPGEMLGEGPPLPPGWSIMLMRGYVEDDGNRSRPDDPEEDFVVPALDAGYQNQPTGNNEVPPPDFYFKGVTLADDITATTFSAVGGAVQVHRAVQMVPDTRSEFPQFAPEQIGAKALASTGKPAAYWSFPTASLSTGDLTAGQDFTVSLSFQVDALPVGEDQYIFSISDQTGVVESALFLKIADAHGASGGSLIVGWQALGGAEQQGGPYSQVTATAPTGSENYSVVPGQEHHITISVSNTTSQVAIFFDGVYTLFNNSMTPWGSASPIPVTYEMAIGAYQGGSTGFAGHVRQIVMYTERNTFGTQDPGSVPMLAPVGSGYLSEQAARGLYYRAYRMRNLSEDVIL